MLCKTSSVVTYLKLVLLYITSTKALPSVQTNNTNLNISKSNAVTSDVSNIPAEGGGKLLPPPTNVTIIPGPNLDSAISDFKQQQSTIINTLSNGNKNGSNNSTTVVISEGGGKSIALQSAHKNVLSNPQINKSDLNTTSKVAIHTSIIPSSSNVTDISHLTTNVVMEGGGKPANISNRVSKTNTPDLKLHEGVIPKKSDIATSIMPERTIPISEAAESSRQKIAPRKGVNNLEYSEFKKLENSTIKPVIKKPLITEASEDESFEVNLDVNSKTNSTIPIDGKPKVPSLDTFNEFSNNTQQYVVPIVIVILSVPLVTIVISFLLKRGAEWWKYRHYRRMDFLINGIYDT